MLSKWYKKKVNQWKKVKYSKKIVTFCISFLTIYTVIQSYFDYKLGLELSPTLTTCVYGAFGGELCLSALIRVFDREDSPIKRKKSKSSGDEIVG